jgi:hypothetical protein
LLCAPSGLKATSHASEPNVAQTIPVHTCWHLGHIYDVGRHDVLKSIMTGLVVNSAPRGHPEGTANAQARHSIAEGTVFIDAEEEHY